MNQLTLRPTVVHSPEVAPIQRCESPILLSLRVFRAIRDCFSRQSIFLGCTRRNNKTTLSFTFLVVFFRGQIKL